MNSQYTTLAVFVTALLGIASSAVVPELRAASDESERIVGGEDAKSGQFPWAVALYKNNNFICTASIISPNHVLTAAHCVVDSNNSPENATLFYGVANVRKSANSLRLKFSKLAVNPNYSSQSLMNDIAIFTTENIIAYNGEVQQVCLARKDTPMYEYRNATAMGWGDIFGFIFFPIIPEVLQHVEQEIRNNSDCEEMYNLPAPDTTICGGRGIWNAVCNGDSGGPLVHLSADKKPIQIGITSYGSIFLGCGRSAPAVWTRVSSYYEFIQQETTGSAVCYL